MIFWVAESLLTQMVIFSPFSPTPYSYFWKVFMLVWKSFDPDELIWHPPVYLALESTISWKIFMKKNNSLIWSFPKIFPSISYKLCTKLSNDCIRVCHSRIISQIRWCLLSFYHHICAKKLAVCFTDVHGTVFQIFYSFLSKNGNVSNFSGSMYNWTIRKLK